eukprot:NODE_988_length_2781_cov_0.348248.p1 type:complete len:241 gc:universal NODE_988_length_2781_cov_0.348248:1754-2476(+)
MTRPFSLKNVATNTLNCDMPSDCIDSYTNTDTDANMAANDLDSKMRRYASSLIAPMNCESRTAQTIERERISEFVVVDLLDQVIYTIQHLAAMCPNLETEIKCLENLLTKDSICSFFETEMKDRDIQQKQYEVEIEYYKAKVQSESFQIKKDELDMNVKEYELAIERTRLEERRLKTIEMEQKRQVIKKASEIFESSEMIELCCTQYESLFQWIDVPATFESMARDIMLETDIYEMIDEE